ncbi:globin-like protein [Lipomyces kononenkoae]|uniref:Globin-like protein n=1 Tax=Lipomyces kononenkoae TaxID=34357 RepID=A0ACC3T0V7_LIPKO
MVGIFRKFKSKAKPSEKPASVALAQPPHKRQPTVSTIRPPSLPPLATSPSTSASKRSSASTTKSFSGSTISAFSDASSTATSIASAIPKRPTFKDIKINLTAEDAQAVKKSWTETIGQPPANSISYSSGSPASLFFNQFYQNLFALRPDMEFMFSDIGRQSAALSGIFQATLAMLENVDALDEILLRLGRRHAFVMGIEPEQFELVGVVFIQTLRDRMGDCFTPQIEATWVKIYSYLASKMVAAAFDDA